MSFLVHETETTILIRILIKLNPPNLKKLTSSSSPMGPFCPLGQNLRHCWLIENYSETHSAWINYDIFGSNWALIERSLSFNVVGVNL